ncbi:protein kinase domain-containing protein [Candidatus Uabimicrobium amorphum]|uniref:Protein kinase n=1 Tax=Uabimicrobium amorphum TaxID=2596890 RepID=A0A5S9IKU7_UABAM|nr:protein kinase [Candidatus Uabimicrobium amorphum]BBM83391.1 protein kinase [Candidatus Uabimicrobium amorphum]
MDRESIKKLWEESVLHNKSENCDPGKTYKSAHISIASIGLPAPIQQTIESSPPIQQTIESSYNIAEDNATANEVSTPQDYELADEISRGGMGIVYKGKQVKLQREIAIKKIKGESNAATTAKFISESLVTAYLDHPNIVPVYDLSKTSREEIFLAMKLVRGTEWKSFIEPRDQNQQLLAHKYNEEAHLRILLNVCNALSYAHSKGIVHCDIKPSNVMVGEFGEVLVMDWGIAVNISDTNPGVRGLSRESIKTPLGTPNYMPWELAEGCGENIGEWTDVYLLGATLYHILMKKPPHGGGMVSSLFAAVTGKLPEFEAHIPKELQTICHKAMAKKINERYQSVADFQNSIQNYLQHKESIIIAAKAQKMLDNYHGKSSNKLYHNFSQAIAGFEQALQLWEENGDAQRGLQETRIAYANTALSYEDFGLADSQLAYVSENKSRDLKKKIAHARQRKLRAVRTTQYLRYAVVAATIIIIVGLSIGFLFVRNTQRKTQQQKNAAFLQLAKIATRKSQQAYREVSQQIIAQYPPLQQIEHGYDQCGVYAQQSLQFLQQIKAIAPQQKTQIAKLQKQSRGMLHLSMKRPFSPALWKVHAANVGKIGAIEFSHDAQHIACAGKDGAIRIYSTLTGEELQIFRGHRSTVNSIKYSENGKYLASASTDKTIRVWNVTSGEQVCIFRGYRVHSVAFSIDNRYVISGSADKTICVWNIAKGREEFIFRGHTSTVNAIAVCGTFVVSGSKDKSIRVWNIQTKQQVLALHGHEQAVNCVCVSPNYIISGSADRTLRLWDLHTGKQLFTAKLDTAITALDYHPQQKIVVCAQGRQIELWNIKTQQRLAVFSGHYGKVMSLDFSSDGKYLVSASHDKTVRLWDIATHKQHSCWQGHTADIYSIVFSGDGKYLASCSRDTSIRLWNAKTGNEQGALEGHSAAVTAIKFSNDSRYMVSTGKDKTIRLWDVASQTNVSTFGPFSKLVNAIAFHRGNILCAFGKEIKVLDVKSKQLSLWKKYDKSIYQMDLNATQLFVISHQLVEIIDLKTTQKVAMLPHSRPVFCAKFSTSGQYIVSGTSDKKIYLWDIKTQKQLGTFSGHTSQVNAVDITRDNRFIISTSNDKTLRMWKVDNRRQILHIKLFTPGESCLFHPEYSKVAFISDSNRTIELWDVSLITARPLLKTSQPLTALEINRDMLAFSNGKTTTLHNSKSNQTTHLRKSGTVLAFSCDGKHVLCSGKKHELYKYDVNSKKIVATMKGHLSPVWDAVFSDDNKYIASVGRDKIVYLWNTTAKPTKSFHGHTNTITSVDFSSDGKRIASGSKDRTVRLWSVKDQKPLATFTSDFEVYSVNFSPNDQLLAIGSNRNIYLWNPHTNHSTTFTSNKRDIRSCQFTQDGQHLVCSFAEGIEIWDIATLQQLPVPQLHNAQIARLNQNGILYYSTQEAVYRWNAFAKYTISQMRSAEQHFLSDYTVQNDMSLTKTTHKRLWSFLRQSP